MTGLVKYDAVVLAIAECHRIDEVLEIRERHKWLPAYTCQATNLTSEVRLRQIHVRAQRGTGKLLIEMGVNGERERRGGDKKSKESKFVPKTLIPKLSDLGITKMESFLWQRLAKIPDEIFEEYMASGETSVYAIVRQATAEKNHEEDVNKVWEEAGMEPLDQEDQEDPFGGVYVRFQTKDARAKFADLVGQNITPRTRSINFPEIEDTPCMDREWVSAPSAEATA